MRRKLVCNLICFIGLFGIDNTVSLGVISPLAPQLFSGFILYISLKTQHVLTYKKFKKSTQIYSDKIFILLFVSLRELLSLQRFLEPLACYGGISYVVNSFNIPLVMEIRIVFIETANTDFVRRQSQDCLQETTTNCSVRILTLF